MRHHWMFNPTLLAITLLAPGLLVACRPLPAARAQATHHVTVIEGSGGGDYAPGDTVRIEPYRMPDTKVFDRWQGQVVEGADLRRAHTSFTMPSHDVHFQAVWRQAPLWAWEPVPGFDSVAAMHPPRLPSSMQGRPPILVLLHDAGQDMLYWRQSSEARLFARAAATRGMGLLAVQSTDPQGRWELSPADVQGNPDLVRLLGAIHADDFVGPLVFVGVGEGAAFAELAGRAFAPLSSVQASAAILVGSVGSAADQGAGLSRLWLLADKEDAAVKAEVRRRLSLLGHGTFDNLVQQTPWPMFPRRFWRVGGMTAGESVQFHQSLVAAGVLDGRGWVLGDPATLDVSLLPEALRPQAPDLVEQLNAGWSGHGFNSHAAERMLDFAWGHGSVAESVPTPEPTRRAYAGHVTVSGGAAGKGDFDGSDAWYTDRDRVHLWAEPDPPGLIFDHWRSENPSLADPRSRHTVFQVLSPSTTISANFAPAPDWRPAQRLVDGRDVYFHAPPDPVGLVFYFHGAGGSSRGWVTPTNAENWQALRDAVARGYAVAVTESGDRQAAQWSPLDPPEANPDMQHVKALRAQLVAEGAIPAGLPAFGIGMSNGGGFVSRVADALGWQGAVVYDAGCRARLAATTTVPIAWHLSENDRRVSNQDAYACHQQLLRRGISTELRVLPPQPLHPLRLRRGPGIGPAEAEHIRQTLTAAGLLDRLDFQIQPPSTSDWRAALAGITGVPPAQVAEQLDVCFTEHQFYSDYDHLALDFFDRQRGVVGTPTPRPAVTLTPGSPGEPATEVPTSTKATPAGSATPADRQRRLWLPMLRGDRGE